MSYSIFQKAADRNNTSTKNVSTKENQFEGIDLFAAKTWIYPSNKPRRQYQYDIVKTALFHNTMVSLPTGLGKTLIAAIVMYNMYRWYPGYKIVFMAPTRPLVAQQAKACREITCIPKEQTIQLTGDVQSTTRGPIWEKHSVFFITPQILARDLETNICPVNKIKCLVFDEAHRARGDYAYCQIVRQLNDYIHNIRILGLSATPGATAMQVSEVLKALHIARLEVRTENSIDVKPYVFNKIIERVVVPLGSHLTQVRDNYVCILDQYTRRLMQAKILTGSAANIHKGRIFMAQKQYKERCQELGKKTDNYLMQDLTFCLTLYHAYELLIKHGLRVFLSFFEEHGGDKGWVRKDDQLSKLLDEIRNHLGNTIIDTNPMPDGIIPDINPATKFGHPKYYKLREIVENHFTQQPDTRVMIFCEYVDSVQEIFAALLSCRPLIRPKVFLGQSAMSQKKQLETMKQFRIGEDCNTIVCTCVAEEGLDVAAVQLIVCFDIANRSPIRLAQRMGRTGRHQIGKIVILVTEGREEQTLTETLQQSSILDERLLNTPLIRNSLLLEGPAVIPPDIVSKCESLHLTDIQTSTVTETTKPKLKRPTKKFIDDEEIVKWKGEIPAIDNISLTINNLWELPKSEIESSQIKNPPLHAFKEKNDLHSLFGPSKSTQLLRQLLKKSENLKLNLPIIQATVSKPTKNRDIRQMFGKATQDANDFVIPTIQSTPKNDEIPIQLAPQRSKFILNLESELNARNTFEILRDKTCSRCLKNKCKCPKIMKLTRNITKPPRFEIPDDSILEYLTPESIKKMEIAQEDHYFNFERYNNERVFNKLRAEHNVSNLYMDDSMNPILTLGNPLPEREESFNNTVLENVFQDDVSFDLKINNPNLEMEFDCSFTELDLATSAVQNSIRKVSTPIKTTKTPVKTKVYEIFKQPKSLPFKKESTIIDLSNSPVKEPIQEQSSSPPQKSSKSIKTVNLSDQTDPIIPIKSHKSSPKLVKSHNKNDLTLFIPDAQSQEALDFFGLNCLEEIFDEPSEPIRKEPVKQKVLPNQKIISKNLVKVGSTSQAMNTKKIEVHNVSPILCSQKPQHPKSPVLFSQQKQENSSAMDFDYVSDDELFPEDSLNELWQPTLIPKEEPKQILNEADVFSEEMFNDSMNFTLLKPVVNSDPNIPAKANKASIGYVEEPVQPVYISDDDLFGDDSLNDELFQVARAVSLREADKNLDSSLKENNISSPRIVTSPILTQSTRSSLFNQSSSQKNPLHPSNTNKRVNGFNKLPETSKFSKLQLLAKKPTENPPLKVITEPPKLFKESPPKPSTSKSTKQAKKSMFQLKRLNNSSEQENVSTESINYEDEDSDDHSLCDFIAPIRKKIKLSLQKKSQNETVDVTSPEKKSSPQKTSQNATNKRSIFQLKREKSLKEITTFDLSFREEVPVKKIRQEVPTSSKIAVNRRKEESPKKKDSSSDDDFPYFEIPSNKLKRNTTIDSSVRKEAVVNSKESVKKNGTGLDKSDSFEIPDDDVFDLSQFTFGSRKKVLGETSATEKLGYSDYSTSIPPPKSKLFKPNRQKRKNEFIEEEAELSGDASSDEECCDDELDSSFVDKDEDHEDALTQAGVDMKAHYLQSIKSPIRGKFKIPNLPAIKNREDIYSQIPNDDHDENEYKFDTFCVETGVEIDHELSFLEIAEMELKKRKRAKKQDKVNKVNKPKSRIRQIQDDSSDEEGVMAEYRQMLLLEQSVRR